MSTQPSRTTIDLAPHTAPRPGLAMALALLAVPGSTVAWELPWGGLWIGLPLALAAIVLGTHARREGAAKGLGDRGHRRRRAVHRADGRLDRRRPGIDYPGLLRLGRQRRRRP